MSERAVGLDIRIVQVVFKSIDWLPFFLGFEFGTTVGDALASTLLDRRARMQNVQAKFRHT